MTHDTDPTTRITDPAVLAAAVAEASKDEQLKFYVTMTADEVAEASKDEQLKFYVTMTADEVAFATALVMRMHPAVFDEVAEIVREERERA